MTVQRRRSIQLGACSAVTLAVGAVLLMDAQWVDGTAFTVAALLLVWTTGDWKRT